MKTVNHPTSGYARAIGINPMDGHYDGKDLAKAPSRACATDTRKFPTRIGARLHYRDGRITDLGGNTLSSTPQSNP